MDSILAAQKTSNYVLEAELTTKLFDRTSKQAANQYSYRNIPNGKFWTAIVFTSNNCWLWVKARNNNGYGLTNGDKAHRYAWRLFNGTIPANKHVLHKCDVRNCVNPDHLFLGTHKDNMADMVKKGRLVVPNVEGEHNPQAKLNKVKVARMRQLRLKTNMSYRKIANLFGVSDMTAYRAIKGVNWK
jgi:hypothetical protein